MNSPILSQIEQKLGPGKLITGEAVRESYHHIWQMHEPLQAMGIVFPESTQDVSEILKICHEHHQPVVIFGGRTGLVGGTETLFPDLIISMEKMDAIEEIDPSSRTMTVQAGVILEHIQQAAAEKDLLFPLNFGARGSAQIGGAIATNAGGLRVFKFGMTRQLVLGLEVVLADGTIISSMKKIIKDNSAYDIKQLFIGSEGTLGITTRAVLKLVEAPKSRNSAFVAFNEYDHVVAFLKFMDRGLAGTLSGFELMWKATYQTQTSPSATVPPPLPYDYNYYVLLESLGSDQEKDYQRLLELLEEALEKQLILDAAPAHSGSDIDWFWKIREEVDPMVYQCRNTQQFDISLPIPQIGLIVSQIVEALDHIPEVEKVFPFGHVADGNIHLIIGKSEQSEALIHHINECVYLSLPSVGGSVSAEHGIGIHKKPYLHLSRKPEEVQLMQSLKRTLDPRRILNRGKVVD